MPWDRHGLGWALSGLVMARSGLRWPALARLYGSGLTMACPGQAKVFPWPGLATVRRSPCCSLPVLAMVEFEHGLGWTKHELAVGRFHHILA